MNETSQRQTLQWQFQLTWKLAEFHLPGLTDEACLWEPAPSSWTVRRGADGRWRPDWVIPEPDPPPVTTIGWLTWHIVWWWSSALAASRGRPIPAREELFWPGNAAAVRQQIVSLADDWNGVLSGLNDGELERPLAYPWPEPRPLCYALAWVNSELMKNIAEIGYVSHLFQASRRPTSTGQSDNLKNGN